MSDNKRKTFYKTDIQPDAGILSITFPESVLAPITVEIQGLSAHIRDYATLHGLLAKIVDCAAIPRDSVTGRTASTMDKYNAMVECVNRLTDLENPSWNKTRGEGTGSNDSLLTQALCRLTGKTRTDITAYLVDKTKEAKTALKASPKVADMIATIQRENLAKKATVSADDMLNDLGL